MEARKFILNCRPEDLRHIYRDTYNFRLFSEQNLPRLLSIGFFLGLILLASIKLAEDKAFLFLFIVFLVGLGYHCIELFKTYHQNKKTKNEIEEWIRSVTRFTFHEIVIGDGEFRYLRDNEIATFDLSKVKRTYRTEDYVFLSTTENVDIVLPFRSFSNNEHLDFLQRLDEQLKLSATAKPV